MKLKFGMNNISIDNHLLPNMYQMPRMHKNFVKARFIIVSPNFSIKFLARSKTLIFRLCFRQMQTMYWMPRMHKNLAKARFIIVSPNFSIKYLTRSKTFFLFVF